MTAAALPDLAQSWSLFWEEQGELGRCLMTDEIFGALSRSWTALAVELPPSARILDLACGAGIVGRSLLRHRPDLHITGIDSAAVPTPGHSQLQLLSSTPMESLPFAESSFDAAVSQFGIEYGDIAKVADEVRRVLRPRGRFWFLVHHRHSAVVRDGAMRLEALRALCSGSLKGLFVSGNAEALAERRQRLSSGYPAEPTVELVCTYLQRRIGCPEAERHRLWDSMTAVLAPELAILAGLERSARSAAELGSWLAPFLAGMSRVAVTVVRTALGDPVAWKVDGVK